MPKVKTVESKISKIERFEVIITKNGKDVRRDASLPNQYQAEKMTKNAFTVCQFKTKFKRQFPGYDVEIKKADGSVATGQTRLSTVRDTYL